MEYAYQNAWTASLFPFLVEFVRFIACWFCWLSFLPAELLWGLKVFCKMLPLATQVSVGPSQGTKSVTLILWRPWQCDCLCSGWRQPAQEAQLTEVEVCRTDPRKQSLLPRL